MTTLSPQAIAQYWSVRRGVGIADRSAVGRLEMAGADCLDLLQRLTAQEVGSLEAGQGASVALVSDKGRVVDATVLYHLGDRLLLLTSPGNQTAVMAWLDRYTFAEESRVTDITLTTGLVALSGEQAESLAVRIAGGAILKLPMHHHAAGKVAGAAVVVARAREPYGGFHVVVPRREDLPQVLAGLESQGAVMVSADLYETLRVEAGMPAHGKEMDERFNPLEARLQPYLNFMKGCYIGQEVVARLDTYQKVQKLLVSLKLVNGHEVMPGAALLHEGKDAGFVTSSSYSLALEAPIALGFVQTPLATPGTMLAVAPDGALAEVIEMGAPAVR